MMLRGWDDRFLLALMRMCSRLHPGAEEINKTRQTYSVSPNERNGREGLYPPENDTNALFNKIWTHSSEWGPERNNPWKRIHPRTLQKAPFQNRVLSLLSLERHTPTLPQKWYETQQMYHGTIQYSTAIF